MIVFRKDMDAGNMAETMSFFVAGNVATLVENQKKGSMDTYNGRAAFVVFDRDGAGSWKKV